VFACPIDTLDWNEAGVLPCVAQRHDGGESLMPAWMSCLDGPRRGWPWRERLAAGRRPMLAPRVRRMRPAAPQHSFRKETTP
jgi:hypothetical protein